MYLEGAHVVVAAIGAPAVAAAWDAPSVLAGQSVGSLAGHLARGAVWLVGEYLDQDPPTSATFDSPDAYFAAMVDTLDFAAHQAIRDRGAAVAAAGWASVAADARVRLAALAPRLLAEPSDRLLPVASGAMRLDDYLPTRIIEQVVHLDDLARSTRGATWRTPDANVRLAVTIGALIGLRRSGADAMVRALYRDGPISPTLPVL
jgi:hypothetical protein